MMVQYEYSNGEVRGSKLQATESTSTSYSSHTTSVSYLAGGVDSGPCLEEYLYNTGMALERCQHQSSCPILYGEVERRERVYYQAIPENIMSLLP